ncbi:MAG: tripartite tricarboxylate transporter permease [Alphaproteobacteria bacterium]|nr:tripartite tricarboxylate transporter permease [Alphaproteobacteria bacterium]
MESSIGLLLGGLATALEPGNLLFALIGCVLGTLVGVLPGLGPVAATAMLLPVTVGMAPVPSIIMLSAIYYGAMYGGTITSVLVNVPGEAASAITCLDGYQMARQGRAGAALAIAAIGSFIGGTLATMGLVLLAQPLARLGLRFGPPEFFALMILGLSLVVGLAGRSILRTLASAVLGLFVAMVGIDPVIGAQRYTFGSLELLDGVNVVVVAMGLFGVGEVLLNLEGKPVRPIAVSLGSATLKRADWRASAMPILRGSAIGFVLGFIPGVSAVVSSFASYVLERKLSRTPDRFGNGAIEGVAGPETANNAHANAALIPLFTLGIPGSSTVAVLMGAFMMNGLTPGPFLFRDHADIAWAVIASLYVGNVILLVLNLPLIPLWASIMRVPHAVLMTIILALCVLGAYTLESNAFNVWMLLLFGIIGYLMRKLDFPIAPLVLTAVLGPLIEQSLRRSLEMSRGDFSILFARPLSLSLLVLAALVLAGSTVQAVAKLRGADAQI